MKVLHRYTTDDAATEGYMFYCPGCADIHPVDVKHPQRAWTWNGDLTKPTFSPSLLVRGNPNALPPRPLCHSFIRDGQIQFLGDCQHALAGKTVPLPPWRGWDNDEEPQP